MTFSTAVSASRSSQTDALDPQEAGLGDIMTRIYRIAAVWGGMPEFATVEQEGLDGQPQPMLAQYAAVLSVLLDDAQIVNGLDIVLSHREAIEAFWNLGTAVERVAYIFLSVRE
jgi:hypothetical protein